MPTTFVDLPDEFCQEAAALLGEADWVTAESKVEKLSKDFYWYSPVLKNRLESKAAGAVVVARDLEMLTKIVRICVKYRVPITLRGGGTGNYGQCIPLQGGIVLDVSSMDKILSLDDGIARVEPGAKLGKIEEEARLVGWELRCKPSTFVKSTMGGFFCGGSGGIGSITWGGIAYGDNVKSVTLLSVEEEPKLIKLEERDAIKALHTYGTTGIMVEVEMRLAPRRSYDQIIAACPSWSQLLDWTDSIARDPNVGKRLVSQFESPLPSFFKPLKKFLPEGKQISFFLIEQTHTAKVLESAQASGIEITFNQALPEPMKPPYLSDYTWNHTTLWALKADPELTYLQAGFGENFREQMLLLKERFGDDILFHLEWTVSNPKTSLTDTGVGVGSIPVIRYRGEEALNAMIEYCESIGVGIANPHTYVLEEGGRHPNMDAKIALKSQLDPFGLLNPGKMKSWDSQVA